MSPQPARGAVWRALVLLAFAAAGCARIEPPSGGPPDITPPRLVATTPESAQANVPIDVRPTLTFSESMEPRSTNDAVSLSPPVEIRQRRWHGKTLQLVFGDTLRHDHIYTLLVTGTARDAHGNDYGTGKTVVFSTGATFPQGLISGTLETRGMSPAGCAIWCYVEGHLPDSTARDFDAVGVAEHDGSFQIAGLAVPGSYRLWVFADLNSNRSFEPVSDVLAAIDTTFRLTPGAPHASGILLRAVNPRAQGTLSGTVIDSVADSSGVLHVTAVSTRDSTKQTIVKVNSDDTFTLRLDPGDYMVRAFRDLDSDRIWQPAKERASERRRITIPPAGSIVNVKFVLRPTRGGP